MENPDRFQLQFVLPYKQQPMDHPEIRRRLEQGFRIAVLQRVSDREVLVTFQKAAGPSDQGSAR
jgi:hypothetical protein